MNTIKLQGKILEVKPDILTPSGTPSLGIMRDNYSFFQRITNPYADKEVKKELERVTKEFTDKTLEYGKSELPENVKKLLEETDTIVWEADKRSVIENALIERTTKEELIQLCKSFFVSVDEINFDKLGVLEIFDVIEDLKKKQLQESLEKTNESQ